ncbi:hypothetical protein HWV62_43429 [Athelia sp. TMB]|nr:hypothetical protein HWV62_43429 [Athelia sp. TMB]
MQRHAKQSVGELISRRQIPKARSAKCSSFRHAHSDAGPALTLKPPRRLSQEHFRELNILTRKIIGKTADGDKYGWEHTRKLRGEERRLTDAVKEGQRRLSTAQEEFHASGADEDFSYAVEQSVLPGTFVEVRRNNITTHGITIGDIFHGGKWMIYSLSSTGEMWSHLKDDIMVELPGAVPQELVSRCGDTQRAETPSQTNARVELLKRLRQMELDLVSVQVKLSNRISKLYPQVKAASPEEWEKVTLFEVAHLVCPERAPDFITRFSLHKLLMDRPKEFLVDPYNYRASHTFHIRPQSHVDRLKIVSEYSHQTQDNPVEAFAARARVVIAQNRQRALESRNEPHSEQVAEQKVFTKADGVIIDFLRDSLRVVRQTQANPYPVNVARIIKAVDMYQGTINDATVYQLLVDLGVMAPWQDLASLDRSLALEQEPEATSRQVAEQAAIVKKGLTRRTTPVEGQVFGPEDFYPNDLLDSIRHDFGDLPVYVIDDFAAEELDDGISFEAIPSEPESTWVHVHIADPTAVIPPTHIFAEEARAKVSTQYFAHRTWPMLPQSAMHTLVPSVGDSNRTGEPERVMSFSFKVDGTGEITDYKVRAGIIRNVTRTTYSAVDLALGASPHNAYYPFGGQPETPAPIPLNAQQTVDVRSLKAVTDRLHVRNQRLPIFTYDFPRATVALSPKPLYTNPIHSQKPSVFRGFPHVTYAVESWENTLLSSRAIVMHCMTAASRIASRWASDRGVPLLRRTAGQPLTLSDDDFGEILASKNKFNVADSVLALKKALVTPAASYTIEPALHWSLGIPDGEGYCRVTSPLRRYSDMVAHWQIKHAMLNPDAPPLFSQEWMEDYGRELLMREKMQKRIGNQHSNFWALQFIQRAMANEGAQHGVLSRLYGYAASEPVLDLVTSEMRVKVVVPELGLTGHALGLTKSTTALGQRHHLTIKSIAVGINSQILFTAK